MKTVGTLIKTFVKYMEDKPKGYALHVRDKDQMIVLHKELFPDHKIYTDETPFTDLLKTIYMETPALYKLNGKFPYIWNPEMFIYSVDQRRIERKYDLYKGAGQWKNYPEERKRVIKEREKTYHKRMQKDMKKRQNHYNTTSTKKEDDTSKLTQLGSHGNRYQYENPEKDILETFDNQYSERDYHVEYIFNEFTSLCPRTKQPDFATIKVEYIPNLLCIETKSLKNYFLAYRNEGAFMETITNKILSDCVEICHPRWMKVTAQFNTRGGTSINVEAEYEAN
jgi:7-cyano-7-deazaguanine reductase